MRTGMFALAAGLACLPLLPQLPPTWLSLALLPLALMLLPWRTYPLALLLFGFVWACFSAQAALDDRLAMALDGRTLWLEGRISGLPEVGEGVVRFQLEDAVARGQRLPQRLRLSWYDGPPVLAGERWRLAVKLKRPRGLVNPQGFDYEAWLLAQRIGATGTIKAGERLQAAAGTAAWRDALRQELLAVEAFGRAGALAALVLGDDSGLSRADWRVLQDTGTVHLLVISGQHVALLAALLYALVAGLARLGLWPRFLPWLPWACALAFAGALGYGLLAGFEVPVRRACVMVALVLLWRLRFRHLGLWWPLLLAFVLVLLVEPLASLQAGLAFSNASLGAVHALAHSLGGFLDMPHGECNALLLEHVVRFNFAAAAERYRTVAGQLGIDTRGMAEPECAQRIVDELARLRASVGIAGGLADRGVRAADIAELAVHAVKDACIFTNPRRVSLADAQVIYGDAL